MDDPALRQQVNHLEKRVHALHEDVGNMRGQLSDALDLIAALRAANARLAVALREVAAWNEETRRTGLADETHLAISGELTEAFTTLADQLAADESEPDQPEPDEYDPGPEIDDQGGMSEYRHASADPDFVPGFGPVPGSGFDRDPSPSPWGHPEPLRADDPDEPTNRDIEPEPADWHDGPDAF